jgi:hypothetical protein
MVQTVTLLYNRCLILRSFQNVTSIAGWTVSSIPLFTTENRDNYTIMTFVLFILSNFKDYHSKQPEISFLLPRYGCFSWLYHSI